MNKESVQQKSKNRRRSSVNKKPKLQKPNGIADPDKPLVKKHVPKWNSSSSSFLSLLSTNNSFIEKKKNTTKRNKVYNDNPDSNSDNSQYSLHAFDIGTIKTTFKTNEKNILRMKKTGNTYSKNALKHKENGIINKSMLFKKTYNDFSGDVITYNYLIHKKTFKKFQGKRNEQGFWWPTNNPCDVRIIYEVKKGLVVQPIKLYYVFEDEDGETKELDFKSCEQKHTSIFFLNRIFQSDVDLLKKMVDSLCKEALFILQKCLISIIKGWNVFLICDLNFISRCASIFYNAQGFKVYYINRPIVRVYGMQSKLECKNCQGYATKVIQNDSIMDVESDIQNISLSNQNSQDDVSSEASTDSETSMIMDELINNDTRVIRDNTNENFDPKQMALDFFSRLSN